MSAHLSGAAPLPFIDSHVHFWDMAHPTLRWDWLRPGEPHPILGRIEAIKAPAFEPVDLAAEARFTGLVQCVHVQAAIGSDDPVDETAWLTELHDSTGMPGAIVGQVDLAEPGALAVLDRHCAYPLFRGVRDFGLEARLADGTAVATYADVFAAMGDRDLVVDVDCEYVNMAALARLADAYPAVSFVVDHLGYPRRRDAEYFAAWRKGITALRDSPNVTMKVSGATMTDPDFTLETLSPWIRHCVDTLSPDRCMIGSNWPVDRLRGSYSTIIDVYRQVLAYLEGAESEAVMTGTAARVFRMERTWS